jgi:UDP-N-acetylmuramate dehydrogenase
MVTSVTFRLWKDGQYHIGYGDLKKALLEIGEPNLENIRKAVMHIRESKLPDPRKLGNAGSFFKNPEVDSDFAEKLKIQIGNIPVYPAKNGKAKLAAGWLIEKSGWKGFRDGEVGVHEKQALVLVNYGNATGQQIFDFSSKIKQSVFEKFGVELEREVNCVT